MIKSFKQYLSEMPIPADWDSTKMGGRNSFASQLKYAQQRAKKIGAGSSRVAFIVPYQGRNTVLKIAKNGRGLVQNEFEANMLSDWYLKGLNITVPMIDYDEKSPKPSWIHTELAEKIKPSDFKKFFGMSLSGLIRGAALMRGRYQPYDDVERAWIHDTLEPMLENNETFSSLVNLLSNYNDIPTGDFRRRANWGIYKNHPVIIDIGVSEDIITRYY